MALLAFFVVTLDALVVNVALSAIGRDLGGGITGPQWAVDGYTLLFAALRRECVSRLLHAIRHFCVRAARSRSGHQAAQRSSARIAPCATRTAALGREPAPQTGHRRARREGALGESPPDRGGIRGVEAGAPRRKPSGGALFIWRQWVTPQGLEP